MPEPGPRVEPAERARLDREDEEERELIRPPDVNRDSNRSATRLELFFDLAFVLFVARCADVLAKDETVAGGRRGVGRGDGAVHGVDEAAGDGQAAT